MRGPWRCAASGPWCGSLGVGASGLGASSGLTTGQLRKVDTGGFSLGVEGGVPAVAPGVATPPLGHRAGTSYLVRIPPFSATFGQICLDSAMARTVSD